MEIWEPKPPGTLWLGLLWDSFSFKNVTCTKYIKILTVNDTGSIANVRREDTGSIQAGVSISLDFKIIFVCFVMCGVISYNKKPALSYDTDDPPNNL
jgi:hypothetical protein